MTVSRKIVVHAKAGIFDMDGVITNTMPDHYRAWKEIFAQNGIAVSQYEVYRREGQQGLQTLREIFEMHKKPLVLSEARKILRAKEDLFKRIVKIRFITGIRRFLYSLHRSGFVLALVTGTSRHEVHQILPRHIYDLFDVVITGTDVRNGKPHPEPYLTAVKKLKIKKKEGIVFENAPFGIESAKKAGLQCLAFETSLPRKYLNEADYIFPSIKSMNRRMEFNLKA